MHDVSEYLKNFFMGPYHDRNAAVLGVSGRHGEKSMVVTQNGDAWWGKVWAEDNFRPGLWPVGFEFLDRWMVGTIIVQATPMRFIKSRHHAADVDSFDFNFDFADWITTEDFNVQVPAANEDFQSVAMTSADNEALFFSLLTNRKPM